MATRHILRVFPEAPLAPDSKDSTSTTEDISQNQLDARRCTPEPVTGALERISGDSQAKSISTPPDSPIQLRPAGMTLNSKTHDSNAMTPPATPTLPKSGSGPHDVSIVTNRTRHGSTSSFTSVPRSPSIHSHPVALQLFDYEALEYVILVDEKGKKRPIGTGVWSDVYLAAPSIPKPAEQTYLLPPSAAKSPPNSPIKSNDSAIGLYSYPDVPSLYAIKAPASTSARKVLKEEGKVLSYLSQFPDSERHVVQFYGQDTRNDALVLKAMDGTLEDWIKKHLNTLDPSLRATELAKVFPTIALSLLDSLIWMQDKNCIHADIKPANVLTSSSSTSPTTDPPATIVYSDFSSTILTTPDLSVHNASPLGGGTWDYLDPSLLSSSASADPSPATDLWSLAITLLFLILGTSPFDAFRHNRYQQREMIKSGCPLQCLAYDDVGIVNVRVMRELSGLLGLDLSSWFGRVLVREVGRRVGVCEWREELVRAVGGRRE